MKKRFLVLILAGEKEGGFRSETPDVLHPVLGKPMASLILSAVKALRPDKISAVLGSWTEASEGFFWGEGVEVIRPKKGSGRGQAVFAAQHVLEAQGDGDILAVQANLALLTASSLKSLVTQHEKGANAVTVLAASGIPARLSPKEWSCSVSIFKARELLKVLPKIPRRNRAADSLKEAAGIFFKAGTFGLCRLRSDEELFEVKNRYGLALAAAVLRLRKIRQLSQQGVTVLDPPSTWIDLDVRIGQETVIYPSVVIEKGSRIGRHCRIDPHAHIIHSKIGDRVKIFSSTVIEDSRIGDDVQAGPFSRLRPGTIIKAGARVGNFVEMKNTVFGRRSKAMHLSYLGDSEIGQDVNIGAGTITCNYDGVNKNKTAIEDKSFIGSGTELVAPVKIGKNAYVAAGSTITKNVAPGALAIARAHQVEKPGWAARQAAKRAKKNPSV